MAAELSVILFCSKAILMLAGLGLGFLLLTAAVNCRAEEDHWERFWAETPVACLGSHVSEEDEIIDFPIEFRLAA